MVRVFTFQVWYAGRPIIRRKTILNELKIQLRAKNLEIIRVERMPLQERYAFDAKVYTGQIANKVGHFYLEKV